MKRANKTKNAPLLVKNKPKELHFWFKSIFFATDFNKIFYSLNKIHCLSKRHYAESKTFKHNERIE